MWPDGAVDFKRHASQVKTEIKRHIDKHTDPRFTSFTTVEWRNAPAGFDSGEW